LARVVNVVESGLYKIKDEYYVDFPHEKHIHIKNGRPFYYAVKGKQGIYWLIPLSSQIEKYRNKIRAIEAKRGKGNCLVYYIGVIAGKERVFRICDMIPITEKYIAGEFVFNGTHYVVGAEKLIREVSIRSRNFIKQLELGRMHSQIGALEIAKILCETESHW